MQNAYFAKNVGVQCIELTLFMYRSKNRGRSFVIEDMGPDARKPVFKVLRFDHVKLSLLSYIE